ncbi:MAG TPA: NAD-dependent epimerase/dehydratase family protein [Anaerolineales bacterium]|nr:NAD-dependent epimerase/dehydratase family protein [Anaerolineales bacterium]HLB49296.1 NAD-dependent epimerase/dehydratase family protein [Anaerolineales bacterium]
MSTSTSNELHVIFGAGLLGKWTARELVRMGKCVRMINRRGKASGLPADVEVVASDAYDLRCNTELTKNAVAVYQCAQPNYHEWAEKFPPLQNAILEAAAKNGAKLIVGDNLYMYGDPQGKPITEDSPLRIHTKKGKVRAAMAEAVLAAHRSGKVRAAIGRASNFFGPDDRAMTEISIRPAVEGKRINLLGRLDQPHTFSYVLDFGKTLAILGTREEALGQVWFTPSPPPVTQVEFVKMLEEEVGHPVPVLMGSPFILRFLGLFNPMIRETVEMMYEWTRPYVVDTSKLTRAFGVQPTPLRQAIGETVAWVRAHGAVLP